MTDPFLLRIITSGEGPENSVPSLCHLRFLQSEPKGRAVVVVTERVDNGGMLVTDAAAQKAGQDHS